MYESFYNLSSGPFQLMPDPRFLFPSEGHKRALSYLMYGMQRREGFVVITGNIGIGKTLLVQKLIEDIGRSGLSVARVAMANLDADGVLPMVASAFGLPHESRSKIGLTNDLIAKILPTYNRGALLIVDEAQTCTPAALEELRAISNLQAHGRALLQVFLVGQSELRRTLAQPNMEQLRQRIITSYHLRPLDVGELRDYIEHRLTAAGWRSDPQLAHAIYPRIHEWSGGVPRRINMLMDRILLYGYLEELHALDEADVQVVINELKAEQGDEIIGVGSESESELKVTATPAVSTAQTKALSSRITELEQAFTAAVGEDRAAQLLNQHEASAEQQALIALNLRLVRLEGLLADRAALDALHEAEHATASKLSAPSQPKPASTENDKACEQTASPAEEKQPEAVPEPQQRHDADRTAEQPAQQSATRPRDDSMDPDNTWPKWRLFSGRN